MPKVFMALEADLTSWLSVRSGLYKYYSLCQSERKTASETDNEFKSTSKLEFYDIYYGLSLKKNGVVMDAIFNPDILYNGPEFISGTTTSSLLMLISLSYTW